MKKLTLEQKAKRYDYLEKVLLKKIQDMVDDSEQYGDGDWWIDVDKFMDDVDNAVPKGVFYLLDKIVGESYSEFYSMESFISSCEIELFKKEYESFLREIGE